MGEEILLNHVAVQCSNKEKADIFFTKILGVPKVKNFTISEGLSESIFGINSSVEIEVYDNGKTRFEVFIGQNNRMPSYEHICIEIEGKKEFIDRCKKYGIEPLIVKREGKDLLFIRDFSNNLYEIKEIKN
ncbi:MAG: VOC family protein [Thermoplasmatales archaeon]|nr:VOC family protein [Thermoplasmatales archaeon]